MTLEITVEGVDYDDLDETTPSDSRRIASHIHDYLQEEGYDVETVGLGEPEE